MPEAFLLRAFLRLQGFFIAAARPQTLIFNFTKIQGGYDMKTLREFDYDLSVIRGPATKKAGRLDSYGAVKHSAV